MHTNLYFKSVDGILLKMFYVIISFLKLEQETKFRLICLLRSYNLTTDY